MEIAFDDLLAMPLVVAFVLSSTFAGAVVVLLAWVVGVEGDFAANTLAFKVAYLGMTRLWSVVGHDTTSIFSILLPLYHTVGKLAQQTESFKVMPPDLLFIK